MRYLLILLSLVPFTVCNSCALPRPSPAPAPAPTVVVDAGPSTLPMGGAAPVSDAGPGPAVDPSVRLACDKLAALHCAEGMLGCYAVLQKVFVPVAGKPITIAPLGCIIGAANKPAVRACGAFVTCP